MGPKTAILALLLSLHLGSWAQTTNNMEATQTKTAMQKTSRMNVDIWSDVACPFCYIGKRQFEAALSKFPHNDSIEVVWHSFQLDPTIQYQPGKSLYQYVADLKGQSLEWSMQIHKQVIDMAKSVGLDYQFDIAKIANSLDAHRLIQFAKTKGRDAAMEERLFHAYFTEGALISDHQTLVRLAGEAGLDEREASEVLSTGAFTDEVHADARQASVLGASGVPFFVLDSRLAVAGAQQPASFLQALGQAYESWSSRNNQTTHSVQHVDGVTCTPGGECH